MFILLALQLECMTFSLSVDNKILTIKASNENLTQNDILNSGPCAKYEKIILEGIIGILDNTFKPCTKLVTVIFPSTCVTLGNHMFNNCPNIQYLEFPDGVATVPNRAFFNCYTVKNITFSKTANFTLDGSCFQLCNSLEKFIVSSKNPDFKNSEDNKFLLTKSNKLIAAAGAYSELEIPSYVVEICTGAFSERVFLSKLTFAPNSQFKNTSGFCIRYVQITEIEFPEGTTYLGKQTLEFDYNLKKITFPSSLITIDMSAIENNPYIEEIIINGNPIGVKKEANGAVYNQNGICIWIPKTLDIFCVTTSKFPKSTLQTAHNLTKISTNISTTASNLWVENNLLYENAALFACPGGLEVAHIASNCTSIAAMAFSMSNIKEIHMENSAITIINTQAFASCRKIESVTFSPNITQMWKAVFINTTFYGKSLVFPPSLSAVKWRCFCLSNITKVDFSQCLTLTLEEDCFLNATNLEEVKLPSNVSMIPSGCFSGCYKLRSINIPSLTTTIQDHAFAYCECLSNLSFDAGSILKVIKNGAFYDSGLTEVSLPDSVSECFQEAFAYSSNLTKISFGEGLSKIYGGIITGTKVQKVEFGKNLEFIQPTALSQCDTLTQIVVNKSNPNFDALDDGLLYNKNTTILVICPGGLSSVNISGNVKEFANSAFYGCSKLRSISFETSNLQKIGESSFSGCSGLQSIEIPGSVSAIEDSAFFGCSGISKVSVGNDSKLRKFGTGAFNGCSNLTSIDFEGTSILESIDDLAFSGCSQLERFTFVGSLKKIGRGAFRECSNLKSVLFENTTHILEEAFYGCASLTTVKLPKSIEEIGVDSFRGCSNLSEVEYCGTSNFSSVYAFTNINPVVFVSVGYPASQFCNLPILRVLDRDCKHGTGAFTSDSENCLTSIGILFALRSDEGE